MIYPDENMRVWAICDSSVILANADYYYTKEQVDNKLDDIIISGGGVTSGEVASAISAATEEVEDYVEDYAYSKGEVDQKIEDIVISGGGVTSAEVQTMIDTSISGKQDTLSAGTGIVISGNVISATGGGGSGATYTAGDGIDIINNEIRVNFAISSGSGDYSIVEGDEDNTAGGAYSHASGYRSRAVGNYSRSEGYSTVASGNSSHAEGNGTEALGDASHAEGNGSIAVGTYSHAEGNHSTANGHYSHSEGSNTQANGEASYAGGADTQAFGDYSFTTGQNTYTNNDGEFACGLNNYSDDSSVLSAQTVFSVGIGESDQRRANAFELKKNGDAYLNGDIYIIVNGNQYKLQDLLANLVNNNN